MVRHHVVEVGPGPDEGGLAADLVTQHHLLDELEAAENVGDVVQPPHLGLVLAFGAALEHQALRRVLEPDHPGLHVDVDKVWNQMPNHGTEEEGGRGEGKGQRRCHGEDGEGLGLEHSAGR